MKILLTIDSLSFGGAQRVVTELANYFDDKGYELYLLIIHPNTNRYKINSTVKLIEPKMGRERLNKIIFIPYSILFMRRNIKRIKPDIIFNFIFSSFFLFITIDLIHIKYISIRNNPNKLQKQDSLWFRKFIFKKAHRIIAQTKYAANIIRNQTDIENVDIIPNPVRKVKQYNIKQDNTILNIGRLINGKGYKDLIYIFSRLQAKSWRLQIVGDGPIREELEQYAEKLNIRDKIDFEGFQTDLDKYLSKAKIFAFTSYSEGFPNALLEAMAFPIPCISYNCNAGPSELINDNINGFLIPTGDKEKFINKLDLLISDSKLREKFKKNAESIKSNYSLEIIGYRYLELFKHDLYDRQK